MPRWPVGKSQPVVRSRAAITLAGVRSPTSSARAASSLRLTSTGWRSSSSATSGASCLERDRDGTVIACSKVAVLDTELHPTTVLSEDNPRYLKLLLTREP